MEYSSIFCFPTNWSQPGMNLAKVTGCLPARWGMNSVVCVMCWCLLDACCLRIWRGLSSVSSQHWTIRLMWLFFVQHVGLRLHTKPYLDQYIWEHILRKTGWITCLRLNHVQFAEELFPEFEEAQAQLNVVVADGDISIVSRIIQTFDLFPDMDIAAKADQFEMLNFLDGVDKAGSCICQATRQMAVHAATNSNLAMLDWLVSNRLEVDGTEVLTAAAATGNMFIISWRFRQDEKIRIAELSWEATKALCKALQAGRVDLATFLVEHFSLQETVCDSAFKSGSLTAVQQLLPAYYEHSSWVRCRLIDAALYVSCDAQILSAIMEFMQRVRSENYQDHGWDHTFCVAAKNGNASVIRVLGDQMPDQLRTRSITALAIELAAARGDSETVRILMLHASYEAYYEAYFKGPIDTMEYCRDSKLSWPCWDWAFDLLNSQDFYTGLLPPWICKYLLHTLSYSHPNRHVQLLA